MAERVDDLPRESTIDTVRCRRLRKCGQPLRPTRKQGRRIHRCLKSDSLPDAGEGTSIVADPLDEFVVSSTLDLLDGIDITATTPGSDDDLDEIDTQLDRLVADWARGDITRREWRHARQILSDRENTPRAHGRARTRPSPRSPPPRISVRRGQHSMWATNERSCAISTTESRSDPPRSEATSNTAWSWPFAEEVFTVP